jgi:hypothetical protein
MGRSEGAIKTQTERMGLKPAPGQLGSRHRKPVRGASIFGRIFGD